MQEEEGNGCVALTRTKVVNKDDVMDDRGRWESEGR